MSLMVHVPDELAVRLSDEATRRGVSVDEVVAETLAARFPAAHDALEEFIGCGDSGDSSWASRDIHELRSELATRRATEIA